MLLDASAMVFKGDNFFLSLGYYLVKAIDDFSVPRFVAGWECLSRKPLRLSYPVPSCL